MVVVMKLLMMDYLYVMVEINGKFVKVFLDNRVQRDYMFLEFVRYYGFEL